MFDSVFCKIFRFHCYVFMFVYAEKHVFTVIATTSLPCLNLKMDAIILAVSIIIHPITGRLDPMTSPTQIEATERTDVVSPTSITPDQNTLVPSILSRYLSPSSKNVVFVFPIDPRRFCIRNSQTTIRANNKPIVSAVPMTSYLTLALPFNIF